MRIRPIDIELINACDSLDFNAVKRAIENGANVNLIVKDSDVEAFIWGDYTTPVMLTVDQITWDVEHQEGNSPKAYRILKFLLEHGADPNIAVQDTTNYYITPLYHAVWLCHDYEISKLLLEYGADPNFYTEGDNILGWLYADYHIVEENEIPLLDQLEALLKSYGAKSTG